MRAAQAIPGVEMEAGLEPDQAAAAETAAREFSSAVAASITAVTVTAESGLFSGFGLGSLNVL